MIILAADFAESVFSASTGKLVIGRTSSSRTLRITVRNGKVERLTNTLSTDYSVRVIGRNGMGIASSPSPDGLVEKAARMAEVCSVKGLSNDLSDEKTASGRTEVKPEKEFDLDEAVDMLKHACEVMSGEGIVNTTATMIYSDVKTGYLDNTGTEFWESYPETFVMFCAVAKNGKGVQESCKRIGRLAGMEIFDITRAEEAKKEALELLKARLVKSGKYDVIMGPELAGLLAHEAIGHACEADAVLAGESILKGRLGERIGSQQVTIVDDPTLPGEYGSYHADHEGVPARKTVLIDRGILSSFLHSRESAGRMKTHSTGNARAEEVGQIPLVRMSNTFFAPGDWKEEEMMSELGRGLLLEGDNGGQVSTLNGEFQFAAVKAYLIEKGEKKTVYRNVMFSGSILDTLHSVECAGRKLGELSPGFCGKGGQSVRVSSGGPYLLVRKVRIGGS